MDNVKTIFSLSIFHYPLLQVQFSFEYFFVLLRHCLKPDADALSGVSVSYHAVQTEFLAADGHPNKKRRSRFERRAGQHI